MATVAQFAPNVPDPAFVVIFVVSAPSTFLISHQYRHLRFVDISESIEIVIAEWRVIAR